MTTFLATAILGALIAVLGVLNMMGNLSSLHWYHRQRVTEENRKPFGRLVGFGTLLIGLALILFGALYLVFDLTRSELWLILGNVQLVVCVVLGLGLSFYAMIKYNKGIF